MFSERHMKQDPLQWRENAGEERDVDEGCSGGSARTKKLSRIPCADQSTLIRICRRRRIRLIDPRCLSHRLRRQCHVIESAGTAEGKSAACGTAFIESAL